jgi:NAD(P) transhydrogenase subunit alpha
LKIGVIKETYPNENRVSLVPNNLPPLKSSGFEITMQADAGIDAGYPDSEYKEKGAAIAESREEILKTADIILYIRGFGANREAGRGDLEFFRKEQIIIGMMEPLDELEANTELAKTGATVMAMEMMPRITRAQNMDVLSSMATISGYKAVLMAANQLPRMFPMLMTAAGTVAAAKVFVIGAGVAGLQAIATAKRLGAVVSAYDVRPAVKEQVKSLGARFIEMELETSDAEGKGGYAKTMGEEFYRKQRELMTKVLEGSDVVITTAAIPGKKAPLLITSEMVQVMSHGSVIIDLAAERGGNCELTQPDKVIIENGVTIVGKTNIPSTIPYHASQMYAKNVSNLLLHMINDGKINLDSDDEIIKGIMIARDGKIIHPQLLELLGQKPGNEN